MTDLSTEPLQTLARLGLWVPADRMAEFEAAYRAEFAPLLKQHGLVESAQRGRQTVEGVFSRLFEIAVPAEMVAKREALEADPVWQGTLLELGTAFGTEEGPLRWHFGTYTAPAGEGKIVEAIAKNVPARPGKGHWHTYDISDGLPGVTVHSILQDREGYMWFCTWERGVSRYDGHKFTSFTTQDGLGSNQVRSSIQDRDGYFWFGTWNGVSRYDGHRFTTLTTQDGLAGNRVRSILQDREGTLWFGTAGGGVSRYDGHRFTTLTTQDGLAGNWVGSMLQDQEGHFWFGTGNGVSRYDGRHFTTFNTGDGLAANAVWAVFQDRKGSLWFGTGGGGVSRYDGHRFATLSTQDGLAHNEVSSIFQDREGYLWFGTWEGGVSRYDGHQFTTFTTQDGLADDQISSILQDREGYLWFSTWGGVSRYDGHNVTFTAQDGLAGNRVRSILQDREENLWFGTDDGGISRYDGHSFTNFTVQDGLVDNWVRLILQDREGSLWFGTSGGGVSRYDGHSFTTFTVHDGLASNYVSAILQDQEGSLWFGTGNGVSRYDGHRFTTFTVEDGLASNAVASLMQDREGYLWFGTWGGVSRYDGHGFITFTTQDGLCDNQVKSILQDREGDLWIGTEGGVSRYDGQRFSTFTIQDGLLPNVASIMQDREGHLWFSTYGGGGYRYDGRTLQTVLRQDGLASNLVAQIIQDQAGRLWFGTNKGVTRFYPSSLVPPPVFIDAVVANQRYEGVSEVEVPDSTKVTAFEFHSISFKTRPEAMVYRYHLKGYEKEWKITHNRQVEYQNLPLGEYVFQVQAVDRDLNYSELAQVRLRVIPDPRDERIDELEERVQERTRELEETHQRLQETQAQLIAELEGELQTAHKLQMGLMPKRSPRIPGLDLAGRCVTANHVGGDFFQYFQRGSKLALCLVDVTGHAMEAAIPVVMFSGILKSQMEIGGAVEDLFGRLNRSLHGTLTSHTFICLAMGELDPSTRRFRFSNAGCPYPYHYQAATGEVAELRVDAYPLGVRPDTTYQTIEVQLEPGDRVVFCSDGIIEATNAAEEMFGFERTRETVRRGCAEDLSAEALLALLMAEVKGFRGEAPQGDDQTAVVLEVER